MLRIVVLRDSSSGVSGCSQSQKIVENTTPATNSTSASTVNQKVPDVSSRFNGRSPTSKSPQSAAPCP